MKYKLTPTATGHLVDIWNYTAEQWGTAQAEKYLLGIESKLRQLSENPDLGRHRPEVRRGYYSFPVARHIVFYLKSEDHIQVIGILHGRMDVDAKLLSDDRE